MLASYSFPYLSSSYQVVIHLDGALSVSHRGVVHVTHLHSQVTDPIHSLPVSGAEWQLVHLLSLAVQLNERLDGKARALPT